MYQLTKKLKLTGGPVAILNPNEDYALKYIAVFNSKSRVLPPLSAHQFNNGSNYVNHKKSNAQKASPLHLSYGSTALRVE